MWVEDKSQIQQAYPGVFGVFESLRMIHNGAWWTASRVILKKCPRQDPFSEWGLSVSLGTL